jgi:hypothetical protein
VPAKRSTKGSRTASGPTPPATAEESEASQNGSGGWSKYDSSGLRTYAEK